MHDVRTLAQHSRLARWFPVPPAVALFGAGVDISDSSIKWMELAPLSHGWRVERYGSVSLEAGIVAEGVVKDPERLGRALHDLRETAGGEPFAHAALPEEAAFVFSMRVPSDASSEQIRSMVEFELGGRVPIAAEMAVFDYDIAHAHEGAPEMEIGVSVFPRSVVTGYQDAFRAAGITLLSLELEARSIARASVPVESRDIQLLVDFGRARTGFAILRGQVPIFTSTVGVGGDLLTAIIMKHLGVELGDAEDFKNEHGLLPGDNPGVHEAMIGTAAALADEVVRHYRYWDSRRNEAGQRVTPVAQVLLCGGSANLKGLPEYIAGRVQAPTRRVNVWQNAASFDEYVPPIDAHRSLGYATAIGLAMRNYRQ